MKTTIAQRIGECFATTLISSSGLSILAYNRLHQISGQVSINAYSQKGTTVAEQTIRLAHQAFGRSPEHILNDTDAAKTELAGEITEGLGAGDEALADWMSHLRSATTQRRYCQRRLNASAPTHH